MVKLFLGYDELTVVPVTITKPTWTRSLPRPLTDSCTLVAPYTQVRDDMENIHTGASYTPNQNVYDTHNDGGEHQSQSVPTLSSTWAHCHAHSLRAVALCQLNVPMSMVIWKIYTQGLHTPQTQMYTIPITTEVLSGKYQSQSIPTLSSTWAHCHAHSLRAAACCHLHVPMSRIIIWKIHTLGLHTPTTPTYKIPITTEFLLGKRQSQYAPPSAPILLTCGSTATPMQSRALEIVATPRPQTG